MIDEIINKFRESAKYMPLFEYFSDVGFAKELIEDTAAAVAASGLPVDEVQISPDWPNSVESIRFSMKLLYDRNSDDIEASISIPLYRRQPIRVNFNQEEKKFEMIEDAICYLYFQFSSSIEKPGDDFPVYHNRT